MAMSTSPDEDPAPVRIRPVWWASLSRTGVFLLLATDQLLFHRADQGWLVAVEVGIFVLLATIPLRNGLTLTGTAAVLRRTRVRRIAWSDVQGVHLEPSWRGWLLVLSTATERIALPELSASTSRGRARVERSYHLIGQWWLAHRGPEWAPRPPAPPRPRPRQYLDADGNRIDPPAGQVTAQG